MNESDEEFEKRIVRRDMINTVLCLLGIFLIALLLGALGVEVDAAKFVR